MELEAKVTQILPVQSGTSKAGKAWQSRDVIVETLGSYPRKVKLKFFGDKAMEHASRLVNGKVYTFHIDLESREYNGRWYTDATCYRVSEGVGETAQYGPSSGYPQQPQTYTPPASYGTPPQGYPQQPPGLFAPSPDDGGDDLPF